MRKGTNPSKADHKMEISSTHRVILSVYIPELKSDYFKDAKTIFKYCIESLLNTVHADTRISIIINGCCEEVTQLIYDYQKSNQLIDQVFYTRENLGKINAIYSIVKSNLEPLITISDADVMFLPDWQNQVEQVFVDFPEAGMVSPVPSSKGFLYSTASTMYYGLFKGKIKFRNVQDPEGLINFQKSVGSNLYQKIHLEKYLVVSNGINEAVVGCGHFVATLRKEAFEAAPTKVCEFRILGNSDEDYVDEPNDLAGFLRLATLGNYAYHLGNSPQPWMEEKLQQIINSSPASASLEIPEAQAFSKTQYKIGKFLTRLLFNKFRKQYFSYLGVNEPY
ncbi:glycosyltransferase family A protein [Algoriphagus aquimarinus]|uniref:Glycosyl transferase family 2 n=1 Tax=Algoriphagus aquimarinus TaxID=237018 RepID=A0A1I0ZXP2_9BACT|nr:glycosyltransferase family A protein [Algoriphagus aquimarinus]SFB30534.1 Glycosyl transferase family 2 [Algoriphagus aquimarinus]|tara:strand:+ start:83911 stop:84918 length:1008 start_codon:yes stop_codon:yes gene_type:complete